MTILDPMTTAITALTGFGAGLRALLDGCDERPEVLGCDPTRLDATLAAMAARDQGPAVVVLDTSGCGDAVLAVADPSDPLVFGSTVDGEGRGPLAGLALRLDRVVRVDVPGQVLATVDGRPVAVATSVGGRRVVVLGTSTLLDDRSLPAADNAALVAHAFGVELAPPQAAARVRTVRPRAGAAPHPAPLVVDVTGEVDRLTARMPGRDLAIDSPEFLRAVAHAGRHLPDAVHDALVDFADEGHPSGALVVRGLPVGHVPATPPAPHAETDKDHMSEFVLLAASRRLGQPVGYAPEHGGELVQQLVPTRSAAGAQTSTSSAVMLDFHTEAAFHPHKPRFLLLLGLRADPFGEARTLLCSIDAVLDQLSLGARAVLSQARFRTSADESYTAGRTGRLGRLVPVLSGDPERPTLTFDGDLMQGTDAEAAAALAELSRLVHANHIGVALGPGDLLVVDNHAAVHGRSPFRARYDGTDRWLQRSFVVADLDPSAGERRNRVVTTRFTP